MNDNIYWELTVLEHSPPAQTHPILAVLSSVLP